MIDLHYDPTTLAGPVDKKVVAAIAKSYQPLDPAYLAHAEQYHGGVPGKAYFTTAGGKVFRIGRFLTLVNGRTKLKPPYVPSCYFPDRDVRVDRSMMSLLDEESAACRGLLAGYRSTMLPFASLYQGQMHPDGLSLADADCNLVVFHYADPKQRPRVAVWMAIGAMKEYDRWADAGAEEDDIHYDRFLDPVAKDFDAFLKMLRDQP